MNLVVPYGEWHGNAIRITQKPHNQTTNKTACLTLNKYTNMFYVTVVDLQRKRCRDGALYMYLPLFLYHSYLVCIPLNWYPTPISSSIFNFTVMIVISP